MNPYKQYIHMCILINSQPSLWLCSSWDNKSRSYSTILQCFQHQQIGSITEYLHFFSYAWSRLILCFSNFVIKQPMSQYILQRVLYCIEYSFLYACPYVHIWQSLLSLMYSLWNMQFVWKCYYLTPGVSCIGNACLIQNKKNILFIILFSHFISSYTLYMCHTLQFIFKCKNGGKWADKPLVVIITHEHEHYLRSC